MGEDTKGSPGVSLHPACGDQALENAANEARGDQTETLSVSCLCQYHWHDEFGLCHFKRAEAYYTSKSYYCVNK